MSITARAIPMTLRAFVVLLAGVAGGALSAGHYPQAAIWLAGAFGCWLLAERGRG